MKYYNIYKISLHTEEAKEKNSCDGGEQLHSRFLTKSLLRIEMRPLINQYIHLARIIAVNEYQR